MSAEEESRNEPDLVNATLVTKPDMDPSGVRTGSPFKRDQAVGPIKPGSGVELVPGYDPFRDGSFAFDQGIVASTAWGGVLASYSALPFAVIAAWLFPVGAVMVAAMGGILAVFGLSSRRTLPTVGALVGHFIAGAAGYVQML